MNPPPWGNWREASDFALANAAWVLGWLDPQEATWVAASALELGVDTHEVRITAGMIKPDRRDHGEVIGRALMQIYGGSMDRVEATIRMVQHQVVRIAYGDDETLWQAVSTGRWIDLNVWNQEMWSLPRATRQRVTHLRDIYYVIDDIDEWSGPGAPASRREDGEKWRQKTWTDLRGWAKREYENGEPE